LALWRSSDASLTQKLSATPKISVDGHGLLLAVKSSSLTKVSGDHTPNLCAVLFAFQRNKLLR
jgi:hypothetical protein